VPFLKGHGTENDFVLLPDLSDQWSPTASQVRALCDRRAGIGGDGVIRIVRSREPGTRFFMDYRNADGSLAQMCGNGARVFARYLVDAELEQPGTFRFATRGGIRSARLGPDGDVSIEMGPAVVGGTSDAVLRGATFAGTAVDVGNPHLVAQLTGGPQQLSALDLTSAPDFDAALFPDGVNVEFVVPLGPDHISMRVYERGVGETRSCGTGTVAAAAAFRSAATVGDGSSGPGRTDADRVRVDVPGGVVQVAFAADGATLTGPAVLVATGTIDAQFWDLHR
jgi:diaminopimelate epimerase